MKKMNAITIISLIFIFIGGIGGILLAVGQSKSSSRDKAEIIENIKSENNELKSQLKELKSERNNLRKELKSRDEKISGQSDKIEDLSNKIVEKSEYIANFISGGNAYPTLELKTVEKGKSGNAYVMFSLENSSDYPIYNIETQVYNYTQLKRILILNDGQKIPKANKEEYLNTIIIQDITTELPPKQFRIINKPFSFENIELIATLRTRTNAFIEKIILYKKDNQIYGGYSILDYNGNLLVQHIYQPVSKDVENNIIEKLNNMPNNVNVSFIN